MIALKVKTVDDFLGGDARIAANSAQHFASPVWAGAEAFGSGGYSITPPARNGPAYEAPTGVKAAAKGNGKAEKGDAKSKDAPFDFNVLLHSYFKCPDVRFVFKRNYACVMHNFVRFSFCYFKKLIKLNFSKTIFSIFFIPRCFLASFFKNIILREDTTK